MGAGGLWKLGQRRALLLAAFWLPALLQAVSGQTSQNADANAVTVKETCPSSNYYGEDFYLGATLLNNTITTLSGCCQLCGSTPLCAWTWCPSSTDGGCTAPLGPVANTTFPAGTCLASLFLASAKGTKLTWSRMQGGNPWVAGSVSAAPQYIDSAASYSDFTETIGSLLDQFLCRRISGGALKLMPLRNNGTAGLAVTNGQEVRYTGVQVVDSAGQKWSVLFQNSSSSAGDAGPLWQYPSNQLAFCDTPTPGCSPNVLGQSTEEGAACESSYDCGVCGGKPLECVPRGVNDMQLTYAGLKVTAQAPTFPIASGQPWDATPNECLQPLSIAAPLAPLAAWFPATWSVAIQQNGSTACSDFNLTAFADGNATTAYWSYDTASTWAPSGLFKTLASTSEVDAYVQQLCSSTAVANASLASAVLAGGADAQKAVLAMFKGTNQTVCPDGTALGQLFVDYVSARGTTNAASARNYAAQFVEAADGVGLGACVDIAVVSLDYSSVLDTYRIHNPSPSARQPPSPPEPSPSPRPPPPPGELELLPNGTVRLSGSESCTQGSVDVVMAGSWGAVCSWGGGGDAVHQRNAQVVCRGQGLPTAVPNVSAASVPAGSSVWMKDLNCTGSESSILDCPHTTADGGTEGSQDCLALSVTCANPASGMCSQRPGRCQKLPGSCDVAQGYCTFEKQAPGTPCLGGLCNTRGECASQAT